MKRNLLFILFFFAAIFTTMAQQTDAHVLGHVVDAKTGEHISYANIMVQGTQIGTSTDATGHFFLKNLPVGKFTLVASAIGYKRQSVEVKIERNKNREVNFSLQPEQIMLDNVVVTANRTRTSRMKAPSIVNVLGKDLFRITNAQTLSQGLVFQPGVRVETNCQNCGFSQVRINGLDGPYSQILIDSRPIFSALAGVYGLEQIPTSMIERVEVVRGGGSALFGANAIGGVINIITKEPHRNQASFNNSTSFIYGKTPDVSTSFDASVVSDDEKSGMVIFGSVRDRKAFDYDGDGFSELPKLNQKNVGVRSFYRFNPYSKLTAEYHHISEFRRGGDQLDVPAHQAQIAEQLDHRIHSGNIDFNWLSRNYKHRLDIYASAQGVNRKSYYGTGEPTAYGKTDDISLATGMQYNHNFGKLFFMPATLTAGTEYQYNDLRDKALGYNRNLHQTTRTVAVFLQNEWKNDNWSILLGGRMDKHNLIKKAIFSPRANIRFSPCKQVNLRAGFSTGFRAPQAFDEELHVDVAGGEAILILLDPNLKPEYSKSLTASGDFYFHLGRVNFNILVEGFYTNLTDIFQLTPHGKDNKGNILKLKTNGSGAVVKGINVEGRIVPMDKLQFQFGATIQSSRYKENYSWSDDVKAQRRMFRTPNAYGYITANYRPIKPLTLSLSGTYTGSMLVQHNAGVIKKGTEVLTPTFFDCGTKVAYTIPISVQTKLELNAGVNNIFNQFQKDFDKGPNRDSGYIYGPGAPRTYYVGLKYLL